MPGWELGSVRQETVVKVLVLGGDGFCGWPCAVNLSDQGHDVLIVDNLSRRKIDIDLEVESLTPITNIGAVSYTHLTLPTNA